MSKSFALIGAAGYIAEKHMKAIKDTGNSLDLIVDINDSVGVIDRYFKDCMFSENLHNSFDYVSICTPNYMHPMHIDMALKHANHAICEKPLALTSKHIAAMINKPVSVILQLRLCEAVQQLKEQCKQGIHDVHINYVTPRGDWYYKSWKGDKALSGGIMFNIGIHLFDMLYYVFGEFVDGKIDMIKKDVATGTLKLERAKISWRLSTRITEQADRHIEVNGNYVDISKDFTDMHTKSYEEILKGNGFTPEDALHSIQIIEKLNTL